MEGENPLQYFKTNIINKLSKNIQKKKILSAIAKDVWFLNKAAVEWKSTENLKIIAIISCRYNEVSKGRHE